MNKEQIPLAFRQLISMVALGATGKKVDIVDIDWRSVLCYAQEQSILPLLGIALIKNPEMQCPEELRSQLIDVARSQSGSNLVRKQRIMNMLREMDSLGLRAQLIKGYPVGECYAYPESRGSTDTDILVDPKSEERVCKYLREKGFHVDMRGKTGHHDVGQHPKLGVVEVHIQLYSELQQEIWFGGAGKTVLQMEAPVQAIMSDMPYTTLGYTDHLIFLTLHAIKHFISTGMGLRMMLDIAVFFSKHKTQIDANRYWHLMETLKFTTLVNSILWALIETGCFDKTDFPGMSDEQPEGIDLLLNDLELGGHMGVKGNQQFDGAYEYSRQVMLRTKSSMQYRFCMLRQKIRDAEKQMFPEKAHLLQLYPVIEKKTWLTPFARIHRMFAYPIKKIKEGALRDQIRTDSTDMPEEAKRRVEMFKTLGMI